MTVYVDASSLGRIGDALASLPYLRMLAEQDSGRQIAFINDTFCKPVRDLIADWGWRFGSDVQAPLGIPVVQMDLHKVFNRCNVIQPDLHMAQGWFACANQPVSSLPIDLPFYIEEPERPWTRDEICISPFSRSDYKGNKLWPLDRWVEVANALAHGRESYIRILGADSDHFGVFAGRGYSWAVGWPLPRVLGLLRRCKLFLSVDNGISHLAHFGGVAHHLLLAPKCLSESFVRNPRGRHIRDEPAAIGIDQVVALAKEMMK